MRDPELSQRRADLAGKIVDRETPRPKDTLHVRTEDKQREHVAGQVPDAAVQKRIGDQLPGLERVALRTADFAPWPQCERVEQLIVCQPLQAINDEIGV